MKFPDIKLPRWPEHRPREPDPPGAIPASLVASAKAASWIAYFCLVYFLWLYTLDIAKDRSAPLHMTHVGFWATEGAGLLFWFPYIIGFAVIAIGIPYVAKIAIPTFMSLDWRGNAWPKAWALFIAVSVSLVVFAGTFTIQGDAILEKGRDAAVAVAQVEQSKAVLAAQIAAKEAELKSMMENRNAYLAQAASVGAAEWQSSYIDRTPALDAQRDRIVRALGAARAADAIRSSLADLRTKAATQTTAAAVSERVEARAGVSWIGGAMDWIQGARAILLSIVMDIVALLMPWIALRLEQARSRQMGDAPASSAYMIEDHSAEAMPEAQPYTQAVDKREQFYDEEGNRIVRRRATFAKVPTRKLKTKVAGKKDETEYEKPAGVIRLNEVDDEPEHSERPLDAEVRLGAGGPIGQPAHLHDSEGQGAAGVPEATEGHRDSVRTELTPQSEEKADDDAGADREAPDGGSMGEALEPRDEPPVLDGHDAEPAAPEEPAPLILEDEEVDRLIEKGVLVEDEEGIRAVSQEDQDSIEQDDRTYNYPRLPAPQREEAA